MSHSVDELSSTRRFKQCRGCHSSNADSFNEGICLILHRDPRQIYSRDALPV
jgi:hypothetical protein